MFSSYGKGCRIELVQAVDRFLTPTPLKNSHPTGSAKGCRGAARDILVVALAGHNSMIALTPTYTIIWYGNIVSIYVFFICSHLHRNATRA